MGQQQSTPETSVAAVMVCDELDDEPLRILLGRYGLMLQWVLPGEPITGSYWGGVEAGLVGNRLLACPSTPVHSLLHEACHYVCMDPLRRASLDTDAGGDYDEENAVCYLQVLLADYLTGVGRVRMWIDMDGWGYTFRLGSARDWFERDAEDARGWLRSRGLIDARDVPTWRLRQI